MIIDCRKSSAIASMFRVVDIATGEDIGKTNPGLFYADDDRAIYRCYDRDGHGRYFSRSVATGSRLDHVEGLRTDHPIAVFADGTRGGDEEVAWTEYYLPIRIEPKPDLARYEREFARQFQFKT